MNLLEGGKKNNGIYFVKKNCVEYNLITLDFK